MTDCDFLADGGPKAGAGVFGAGSPSEAIEQEREVFVRNTRALIDDMDGRAINDQDDSPSAGDTLIAFSKRFFSKTNSAPASAGIVNVSG